MGYRKNAKDIRPGEIAKLDDPGSPDKCCCIHLSCCGDNGHSQGQCKNTPEVTVWKGHVEWYCLTCRDYQYGGSKANRGPGTS
jgi:hypothetical protein